MRIATPLRRNGQTIAVLYGVYLPNQLRAMLAHRLFDNSSHTELVTSAGDVIAAPNITYHTLDDFIDNKATYVSSEASDAMYNLLHNRRSGFISYKLTNYFWLPLCPWI